MLEKQDLQQIKEVVSSSLEDFAVIVNNGFQEQREYMDEKFGKIDERFGSIKDRLDRIELRLNSIEDRLDKLEQKVDRVIRMETEDFNATNSEVENIKLRLIALERLPSNLI